MAREARFCSKGRACRNCECTPWEQPSKRAHARGGALLPRVGGAPRARPSVCDPVFPANFWGVFAGNLPDRDKRFTICMVYSRFVSRARDQKFGPHGLARTERCGRPGGGAHRFRSASSSNGSLASDLPPSSINKQQQQSPSSIMEFFERQASKLAEEGYLQSVNIRSFGETLFKTGLLGQDPKPEIAFRPANNKDDEWRSQPKIMFARNVMLGVLLHIADLGYRTLAGIFLPVSVYFPFTWPLDVLHVPVSLALGLITAYSLYFIFVLDAAGQRQRDGTYAYTSQGTSHKSWMLGSAVFMGLHTIYAGRQAYVLITAPLTTEHVSDECVTFGHGVLELAFDILARAIIYCAQCVTSLLITLTAVWIYMEDAKRVYSDGSRRLRYSEVINVSPEQLPPPGHGRLPGPGGTASAHLPAPGARLPGPGGTTSAHLPAPGYAQASRPPMSFTSKPGAGTRAAF